MKPHPFISCCFRNFWMCPLSKSQDDTKEQSEKAKRSQVIPDSTSHVPKMQIKAPLLRPAIQHAFLDTEIDLKRKSVQTP